ncbi:hypothetical protein ACFOTA_22465 [Chitinophaga sp. GCM10012297]|uniref:Thymidine phosphorylase n=2 Tax=Chitinophagaceae TaxID=563835 RepID=A0ABS3YJY4_9BACT|nr:hypothetical protein [Chitinophaga chungangae]
MGAIVTHFRQNEVTDDDILHLAVRLADSGEKILFDKSIELCDIPSTGGPGSLSTILCPLFLLNLGKSVLKLGVPGRPAGGIDVLAQIEDYNIEPDSSKIHMWLEENNYVHFLANNNFTPLDALLFNFRKKNNGVSIPSLAIASLLSKKIAVGLSHIGLDVRVSEHGNFGHTLELAKSNAKRFNRIANLAGIKAKSFITDGRVAQQPYIGRGEALLAVSHLLDDTADDLLQSHAEVCNQMACSVNGTITVPFSVKLLSHAFFANVETQGGKKDSFEDIVFNIKKGHQYYISAKKNGYFNIDLLAIRDAIVGIQQKADGRFPDPCGLVLKAKNDSYVQKGDIICSFRCIESHLHEFRANLERAVSYLAEPIDNIKFEEIV